MSTSKSVLSYITIFVVFSVMVRLLYPFGDEPDFFYRAFQLLNSDHPWWSPYHVFYGVYENTSIVSNCQINAGAFSLWAYIDPVTCTESLDNILSRLILTFLIVLPLLVILVFPKLLKIFYWNKEFPDDISYSLKILSISLISPGILFYIGVLAEEQLVLVLSLFSFLVWRLKIIIILLFIMIFILDKGNSIIFLLFFSVFYSIYYGLFDRIIRYKKILFILLFLFVLFLQAYGVEKILSLFADNPLVNKKASAIIEAYAESDLIEKYPIYLRPIITFMSAIMSLPSGVKNVPAIGLAGLGFLFLFIRFFRYKNHKRSNVMMLYSSIFTIILFIFLFPTYANAKYYIWLLPFILKPLFFQVDLTKAGVFIASLSLSNFLLLFLYRL